MKRLLRKIVNILASFHNGKYAGKMIGAIDFCRNTICENKQTFAGQIHERMRINNIIPTHNTSTIKGRQCCMIKPTDKVKLRIVYPAGCAWNHIHSMYEAFAKDNRFQTYVLVRDAIEFTTVLDRYGCHYVTYSNYNFEIDRPDVFIATFYSSYDKDLIYDGCQKYIGKVFAEIPNVVMNEKNDEIHWKFVSNAYKHLKPDYWLLDPLVYNSIKKYVDPTRLVKMGSPQFDEIFEEVGKKHPWPETWQKLKNKKIFLWATDHGINESYPTNGFTIDIYLSKMLS